jgi:hypothetical protein
MQTNAFTIEKNVPLPSKCSTRRAYPFAQMEVGDSFAFPLKAYRAVSNNSHMFAKRNGGKFATRKIDAETGRCWRVA